MIRAIFLIAILLFSVFCEAKPPALSPRDTRIKIDEILKAHVTYQELNDDLIKKSMINYLEEIDPSKTYLIESEVLKWTEPSNELVQAVLLGYKKEDFSAFEEIHLAMIKAIGRRNEMEKKLTSAPLVENVQSSEFKDLKWCKDENELFDRLVRIRSMQMEAACKLSEETQEHFMQRLAKRRSNREDDLIAQSDAERKQVVLSFVLKATSSALDSQTAYFTPAEANQFMIQVQQKLYGIGAQLRDDLSGFTIMRLLEGGPALLGNKLKVGDRIIAVNHEPVVGMEITEAVELIRGPQGTSVHLTILRELGEEGNKTEGKVEIEIVRGEIVLKESRLETSYEPYGDGVIGVIHLFSFYADSNSSSTTDIQQAIEKLKKEHKLKGIILDLRNNAGGLLPQAVTVAGLFIGKGVVVSVKDNTQKVQHLRNVESKPTWDGPLVVLTNRWSASAAEIVAGALQDYGRAILIGDATTFGKGTFQTFTLDASNNGKVNPKGEYKVTRGRYYTVAGRSPQLTGVQTDIVVPGLFAELEIGEKYSKFPLANDAIPPQFNDELLDIPLAHRKQMEKLYKFNLQQVLKTYTPLIDPLKANSQERMQSNKNYQNFLKEAGKKDFTSEAIEMFGQVDLQLQETTNIMKDFIFLLEQQMMFETKTAS